MNGNNDKTSENFDKEIDDKYYHNDKPVNGPREITGDDWIYHDTYGSGCVIERTQNNIDVFFMERGSMKIEMTSKLHKIVTFNSKLLDKYLVFDNVNYLNDIINEYKSNGKEALEERDLFYQKWKPCLLKTMTPHEIYNFFGETSKFWNLRMLKKDIFTTDLNEFNDYMNILKDDNLSISKRFDIICNEAKYKKIFGVIGCCIASAILSILYPKECIVYTRARDDFLKYFNIKMQNTTGKKSILDEYFQYSFFGRIFKEKYNFRDLAEVDCFVGFVKVNYLKK
jgi:hypothetical protein